MTWFGGIRRKPRAPEPGQPVQQAVNEMLDRYHPRASVSDGDRMLIQPGKVLTNIAFAMERVDTDISTPVSIEEDGASVDELVSMVRDLGLGPALAVHVANTAMEIMSARYSEELVRRPLPPQFDLRELAPLTITDQQHEIAKTIFNRRATSAADLAEDDVPELESLGMADQVQVFVALFYMFGKKVGARCQQPAMSGGGSGGESPCPCSRRSHRSFRCAGSLAHQARRRI
jgi:hypothetical protein